MIVGDEVCGQGTNDGGALGVSEGKRVVDEMQSD
jgi:hypothetical protein